MAKFEVREVFRLTSRGEFVIAGTVAEGEVRAGMCVSIWIDSKLFWDIPIKSIEFIDRIALKESLVALVCEEQSIEEALLCSDFCPLGTVIDVKDAENDA
jgi:hypothetical protein